VSQYLIIIYADSPVVEQLETSSAQTRADAPDRSDSTSVEATHIPPSVEH